MNHIIQLLGFFVIITPETLKDKHEYQDFVWMFLLFVRDGVTPSPDRVIKNNSKNIYFRQRLVTSWWFQPI